MFLYASFSMVYLLFSSDNVAKLFLLLPLNEFHSWSSEEAIAMHGKAIKKTTNIKFIFFFNKLNLDDIFLN